MRGNVTIVTLIARNRRMCNTGTASSHALELGQGARAKIADTDGWRVIVLRFQRAGASPSPVRLSLTGG